MLYDDAALMFAQHSTTISVLHSWSLVATGPRQLCPSDLQFTFASKPSFSCTAEFLNNTEILM